MIIRRFFSRSSLLLCFLMSFLLFTICSCNQLPDGGEDIDEPEIGEIFKVPDYYFEDNYLDNRVDAINEAIKDCSDDCESFFWITDMHWEPSLNTRESPHLMQYIASKTGIKKIINGGDTGNAQDICKDAIARLIEAIGSNSVYSVAGNHEVHDASRYDDPLKRVNDELRSHNTDIVYGDNNKSYFFFDSQENNIRYIGLSAYSLVIGDGVYNSGYTTDQLNWLKNTALDVNEGWTIIIFTHALYNVRCTIDKMYIAPSGADEFINAIDNYKGNGKIACVLIGHTHRDRIHIGNTGVPYIISASDRYAPYQGDINVERIPGTISEQHFEVVVIDKGRRTVKLFSIGANARNGFDDEPGKEVDVRIVNY